MEPQSNEPETDGDEADSAADAGTSADAAATTAVRELRITVARTGGVAGMRPSWSIIASEEPEVDSWLSLVESCPWDGAADDPGEPDRFTYTIRVVIDPAQQPAEERDARVPERELGPWRDLIDRVKDASRTQR